MALRWPPRHQRPAVTIMRCAFVLLALHMQYSLLKTGTDSRLEAFLSARRCSEHQRGLHIDSGKRSRRIAVAAAEEEAPKERGPPSWKGHKAALGGAFQRMYHRNPLEKDIVYTIPKEQKEGPFVCTVVVDGKHTFLGDGQDSKSEAIGSAAIVGLQGMLQGVKDGSITPPPKEAKEEKDRIDPPDWKAKRVQLEQRFQMYTQRNPTEEDIKYEYTTDDATKLTTATVTINGEVTGSAAPLQFTGKPCGKLKDAGSMQAALGSAAEQALSALPAIDNKPEQTLLGVYKPENEKDRYVKYTFQGEGTEAIVATVGLTGGPLGELTFVGEKGATKIKAKRSAARKALEALKKPGDKPVADKPVADKPVADKPVADKPVADKPVADKPVADKPVADKPVADKPVADKPVADKPVADKPVADKPVEAKAKPAASLKDLL